MIIKYKTPKLKGFRNIVQIFILTILIIGFSLIFLAINFNYLPQEVGLFFNKPWGENQLGEPKSLFILPIISSLFLISNFICSIHFLKVNKPKHAVTQMFFGLIASIVLSLALVSTIYKASTKIFYLNFEALRLIFPWGVSFFLSYFFAPYVIKFAKLANIMDDPKTHKHPAMLLTKPIPRAGSLAFILSFLITSLFFLPLKKTLLGIYLGSATLVIIGAIDDKKKYISPKIRLFIQLAAAIFVVAAGVGITYITNPFANIIRLDSVVIPVNILGTHSIVLFADILAIFWIIFLSNAVSWSNGVDGQFSGFIGITALIICLVALKTGISDNDPTQLTVAGLAVITSGAALGLTPYTWHPQKVLWGFGATSAGLIIGALSILSLSKIYIVSMVLLFPVFDSIFTGFRRIFSKHSPLAGDRGHLHHRLLDLGWSKPKVASFYWIVTAIFGVLTVFSNENDIDLNVVRFGILAVGAILTINVLAEKRIPRKLLPGLKFPKAKELESDKTSENR